MEALACGEIGLQIDYFYDLTPRQFDNILTGYRNKQESEIKENWIHTRKLMFAFLQPHLKRRSVSEKDIMLFPWEQDSQQEVIDLEKEIEAVELQKLYWKQIDEKRNKA